MTWFTVLKIKQNKRAIQGIEYVNNIMADGEKRTINEILDKLFEEYEKGKKTSVRYIPTRGELRNYLTNSRKYGLNIPEYNSGYFDRDTGVQKKTRQSRHTVLKFWLKK